MSFEPHHNSAVNKTGMIIGQLVMKKAISHWPQAV